MTTKRQPTPASQTLFEYALQVQRETAHPAPARIPPAKRRPATSRGRRALVDAHHAADETLDDRFDRWIRENPRVLDAFIRRADQYLAQGYTRLGAKRIAEDLRADKTLWTNGDPFKINNLFVSRLARLAVSTRRDLEPYFEFRELQS